MIYFDNAATTKINKEVLASFNKVNEKYFANPASNHKLGLEVLSLEDTARNQIAKILNRTESEIIFTSGASESNNLAIKGTCLKYKNRGNHIITTKVEHPSVLNVFKQMHDLYNFDVTYLDVNKDGVVELDTLKKAIKEDTILVSIMSVNNEVGSINDIASIGKYLKQFPKIIFHSDATQAIGKINIDFSDVDLLTMSAHKLNGFKGSGLLLRKRNIDLVPLIDGGGQEYALRSGTNNFPYEVALAKTLRIAFENMATRYEYVSKIHDYMYEKLSSLDGIRINSPKDGSPYIINFSVNKKASVVQEGLSLKEIYVSTKSACSSKKKPYSYVIEAMGYDIERATNAIRVSFSYENTLEEVSLFIEELQKVLKSIK